MAANAIVNISLEGDFGSAKSLNAITSEGGIVRKPTLTPAKTGTLSVRGSNTAGTLTLEVGHGILTADKIDIYWVNPDGTYGYRRNVTVGTVATNDVPFTVGIGDNLPVVTTAVTAMKPSNQEFAYLAAGLIAFTFSCDYPAQFTVFDGANAVIFSGSVDGINDAFVWFSGSGVTTPFTANPSYIMVSHGSNVASAVPIAVGFTN